MLNCSILTKWQSISSCHYVKLPIATLNLIFYSVSHICVMELFSIWTILPLPPPRLLHRHLSLSFYCFLYIYLHIDNCIYLTIEPCGKPLLEMLNIHFILGLIPSLPI